MARMARVAVAFYPHQKKPGQRRFFLESASK